MAFRREQEESSDSAGSAMSFGAFVMTWQKRYVETYLRPSTQRNYAQVIRDHLLPPFGKIPLKEITRDGIARLAEDTFRRGKTAKTVNNVLFVLRRCLYAAQEWDMLPNVPRIRPLKVAPPRFDFLTPAESERLLTHIPSDWRTFFLCALRTGMRAGELLALHWDDVDLERGQIAVRRSRVDGIETTPKNNRFRYIPIARDLGAALSAAKDRRGHVFQTILDEPLARPMAERQLKRALKRAGLRPLGLHALRHTFASQLAGKSVPLLAIQMLLGHSTMEMTRRYAHLSPDFLRGTVEVLMPESIVAVNVLAENGHKNGHSHLPRQQEAAGPIPQIPASHTQKCAS